jgi:hypothetical protein
MAAFEIKKWAKSEVSCYQSVNGLKLQVVDYVYVTNGARGKMGLSTVAGG